MYGRIPYRGGFLPAIRPENPAGGIRIGDTPVHRPTLSYGDQPGHNHGGFTMSNRGTLPRGVSGIADQLHAVAILLQRFESLQEAEYYAPRWLRQLSLAADRAVCASRQRRSLHGVHEACSWIAATIELGVYTGPAGEPLRS